MFEKSSQSNFVPSPKVEIQRDQGLGVPSARSYLLTVLGEFAVQRDSPIWTNAFINALGALGVDEKTVRQTLARSSAKGLLDPEKVGRRTRWHLTPRARNLLAKKRIEVDAGKPIVFLHHPRHPASLVVGYGDSAIRIEIQAVNDPPEHHVTDACLEL